MLLYQYDFPDKNTRVGCHFLLQGIFLTQGSNPGLLHCRHMLCPLSHQGSKVKRQPSEWEKIIVNETTDKGLISKIYKQLMQLNTRKTNITDLMDVSLSELRELVMDREAWHAAIHGVTKSQTRLSY